jgi:polar amino acid transport system substrate-binding protein
VGVFNDYPPFGFVDDRGRAVGFSIDYWKLLASRLGLKVKFVPMTFERQLNGLKKGGVDSLAGIFPLPERVKVFSFTPRYFTIFTHIFTSPKLTRVKSLGYLAGRRVGAVRGDSGMVLAEKAGLKVTPFAGYEHAVLALGKGEVHAIVMDEPVVSYYRAKYGLQKKVLKAGAPVDMGHMCLPVKKENQVLLGILTKGVAQISAYEVESMARKWFK